jgi:hypothetical protein
MFLVATLESPSVFCPKWTTYPSIFHPFSPCFSPKSPENPQAADDLQGEAFGAKVTPWQQVPADEVGKKGEWSGKLGEFGKSMKIHWFC